MHFSVHRTRSSRVGFSIHRHRRLSIHFSVDRNRPSGVGFSIHRHRRLSTHFSVDRTRPSRVGFSVDRTRLGSAASGVGLYRRFRGVVDFSVRRRRIPVAPLVSTHRETRLPTHRGHNFTRTVHQTISRK